MLATWRQFTISLAGSLWNTKCFTPSGAFTSLTVEITLSIMASCVWKIRMAFMSRSTSTILGTTLDRQCISRSSVILTTTLHLSDHTKFWEGGTMRHGAPSKFCPASGPCPSGHSGSTAWTLGLMQFANSKRAKKAARHALPTLTLNWRITINGSRILFGSTCRHSPSSSDIMLSSPTLSTLFE